jgi:hypothetical protein
VSFFITFPSRNPSALMSDLAFVCALRRAFSQLVAAPISAVLILAANSVEGTSFPTIVSQVDGSCGPSRVLSSYAEHGQGRRAQSLSPITVRVSVDISKTARSLASPNAEQLVRADVDSAFTRNPALIDSLFSDATLAACSAQGISVDLCPNPPSFVVSLSSASQPPATESGTMVVVPTVAGAVGAAVFVAGVLVVVLWWRAKSSQAKVAPAPS